MHPPCPEIIVLELARMVETGTDWMKRFLRYDQLLDAGLSDEEAASLACDGIDCRAEITRRETDEAQKAA